MGALPSSFDYRGFRIQYERKEGPGADWEFYSLGWDGDPEDRSPRGHNATAGECIEEIDDWCDENEPAAGGSEATAAHHASDAEKIL